ncbi:enoyl-CoA hydratase-related protein [Cupriavidus basilensis]
MSIRHRSEMSQTAADPAYQRYTSFDIDRPASGVLRITLNRSEKLNTLAARAGVGEMPRIFGETRTRMNRSRDSAGAGKSFSAGGDFDLVDEMIDTHEAKRAAWREAAILYNIVNCLKPIKLPRIQGAAVGAGCGSAFGGHSEYAARSARIVDGHTRLGVAAVRSRCDHSAAAVWYGEGRSTTSRVVRADVCVQRRSDTAWLHWLLTDEALQEKCVVAGRNALPPTRSRTSSAKRAGQSSMRSTIGFGRQDRCRHCLARTRRC